MCRIRRGSMPIETYRFSTAMVGGGKMSERARLCAAGVCSFCRRTAKPALSGTSLLSSRTRLSCALSTESGGPWRKILGSIRRRSVATASRALWHGAARVGSGRDHSTGERECWRLACAARSSPLCALSRCKRLLARYREGDLGSREKPMSSIHPGAHPRTESSIT